MSGDNRGGWVDPRFRRKRRPRSEETTARCQPIPLVYPALYGRMDSVELMRASRRAGVPMEPIEAMELTLGILNPCLSQLSDMNAQLAATAASDGQSTATRLVQDLSWAERPMTPGRQFAERLASKFVELEQAGRITFPCIPEREIPPGTPEIAAPARFFPRPSTAASRSATSCPSRPTGQARIAPPGQGRFPQPGPSRLASSCPPRSATQGRPRSCPTVAGSCPPSTSRPATAGACPPGASGLARSGNCPPAASRPAMSGATAACPPGQSRLAAPGQSRLAAPGQSRLAAPGQSRLAAPGQSRLAAPGQSCLAAPGQSRLAAPGQSRLAAPGQSRLAAPGQSRQAAPATSGTCPRGPLQPVAGPSGTCPRRPLQTLAGPSGTCPQDQFQPVAGPSGTCPRRPLQTLSGPCPQDQFQPVAGPSGTCPRRPLQTLAGPSGTCPQDQFQPVAGPSGTCPRRPLQTLAGPSETCPQDQFQPVAGPSGTCPRRPLQTLAGPSGPCPRRPLQTLAGPSGTCPQDQFQPVAGPSGTCPRRPLQTLAGPSGTCPRGPSGTRSIIKPSQTLVLQPGDIDPTETTVITVPAPEPSRRRAKKRITWGQNERREYDIGGVVGESRPLPCSPPRPAGLASPPETRGRVRRRRRDPCPVEEPEEEPEEEPPCAADCQNIPETTSCPTNIRAVTTRPIASNPRVSVLADDEEEEAFNEDDLITAADFESDSFLDDYLDEGAGPAPPEPSQPPAALGRRPIFSPPRPAPQISADMPSMNDCDLPSTSEIFEQIKRNKERWEEEQSRKDREFVKKSKMKREDNAGRVSERILTKYYKEVDPTFAEYHTEEWDQTEVPCDDLLDVGEEPCVVRDETPFSRELMEAMREPDYGPYASELLSSNVQPICPQDSRPGQYSQELFENIELCPTTGYTPGPFASELQAHVQWTPPQPTYSDPFEDTLISDLPCPPPVSSDPCDIDDLLGWL